MKRRKRIDYCSILKIDWTEIKKEIPGVYMIKCTANNKVYIGASNHIYRRWKAHVRAMLGFSYSNKFLVSDAVKYGIENFEFSILELCESGFFARFKEDTYIEKYKSHEEEHGYNILRGW